MVTLNSFIDAGFAEDYSITDRFQFLEDKRFLQQEIIEKNSRSGVSFNFSTYSGAFGYASDLTSLADSGVDEVEGFFNSYTNKEFFTHFNLEVIVPFRKINLVEFELTPKFYFRADLGLLSANQAVAFTETEFDAFVLGHYTEAGDQATIREILSNISSLPSAGEVVFQHFLDEGACNTSSLLTFCNEKIAESDALVMPANSSSKMFLYGKTQYKVGMLLDFQIVDDWLGYINIYGLHRGDNLVIADENTVNNNSLDPLSGVFDFNNSQQFFMLDAKFSLNYRPISMHFLIQEVKLTRYTDNIDEAGDLYYRNTTFYNLNVTYHYFKNDTRVLPFTGFHKRRGYDLMDGLYLGTDFHNTETGSRFRMMFDKHFFYLSPAIKLKKLNLGYKLQMPLSSTVENNITNDIIHEISLWAEL